MNANDYLMGQLQREIDVLKHVLKTPVFAAAHPGAPERQVALDRLAAKEQKLKEFSSAKVE